MGVGTDAVCFMTIPFVTFIVFVLCREKGAICLNKQADDILIAEIIHDYIQR